MDTDGLILGLAEQLGVGVLVDGTFAGEHGGGAAGEDFDGIPFIVLLSAPCDEISTLVALHELGHWATRWGPQGGDRWGRAPRIELEIDAWAWAVDQYPARLTQEQRDYILESVGTYLRHPRYGPRGHSYTANLGRLINMIDPTKENTP